MMFKVVKNRDEHKALIKEIQRLMVIDPDTDTEDYEKLKVLSVLAEDFEKRNFISNVATDAVDAIEFRMSEEGLRQADLVQFIGSRGRVSEILSRKRPLTLPMIRSLSEGLGIPLEALVTPSTKEAPAIGESPSENEWQELPVEEMKRRGYFKPLDKMRYSSSKELINAFFHEMPEAEVMFRTSIRGNASRTARFSAIAWTTRVLCKAKESNVNNSFDLSKLDQKWFRELASLSWFNKGPQLAVEFLEKYGVRVVFEQHLPKTLIDGAAMLMSSNQPVIGLTLRHDRIDNFWFTLFHELAHIVKHININEVFLDSIDTPNGEDVAEREADRVARDHLIPRSIWRTSRAFLAPSRENILSLSDELHIHPAIIVGRLHRELDDYTMFRDMLGQGTIKSMFFGGEDSHAQ